ncbi:MAG: hypothetical protein ACTSRS_01115 [Candidatus Helarchaeota archaeon]
MPTHSRYLVSQTEPSKVDFVQLSKQLLMIPSPFALWNAIINSPELAVLNEALAYGDQPLSTHLLLTLAFGVHLLTGTPAYVMATIVPRRKDPFLRKYWYKIFHVTRSKEVSFHVIEPTIPRYPSALVQKVVVKSIRPPTGWLRIQ